MPSTAAIATMTTAIKMSISMADVVPATLGVNRAGHDSDVLSRISLRGATLAATPAISAMSATHSRPRTSIAKTLRSFHDRAFEARNSRVSRLACAGRSGDVEAQRPVALGDGLGAHLEVPIAGSPIVDRAGGLSIEAFNFAFYFAV
jgi:hypothetical protein